MTERGIRKYCRNRAPHLRGGLGPHANCQWVRFYTQTVRDAFRDSLLGLPSWQRALVHGDVWDRLEWGIRLSDQYIYGNARKAWNGLLQALRQT